MKRPHSQGPDSGQHGRLGLHGPDAPGSLTVVANWIPAADPGGNNLTAGRERYYVKIDNTGDGYEDAAYRWDFDTKFRNPNSFLYAASGVTSVNDQKLNLVQTYDLYKETYRNRKLVGSKRIANNAPVVPDNVGLKTIPNFAQVEAGGVTPLKGGGKTIVTADDDGSSTSARSSTGSTSTSRPAEHRSRQPGRRQDDVAGYNTKSFVLQVPEREVTRDGNQVSDMKSKNAVVGVWSTTSARGPPGPACNGPQARQELVQVSRLGNFLINEVIVPIGKKDKFNATSPADDAKNFGQFALNPSRRAS